MFGTSLFMRLMFQAGVKIYNPPIPLSAVKDYEEAIQSALTALRQKSVNISKSINPGLTKHDWSLELEGYGISFELIGDDILYTIAHGIPALLSRSRFDAAMTRTSTWISRIPPTRRTVLVLQHAQQLGLRAAAKARRSRPGTGCRRGQTRTGPSSWPWRR